MNKRQKYKLTYTVTGNFDDLIDEETFKKQYNNNLLKLCKWMFENEGVTGWTNDDFKLINAELI